METRDRIYQYIAAYLASSAGRSPTYREIAEDCNLAVSCVFFHVQKLKTEGRVTSLGSRSRTLRLAVTT